MAETIEKSQLIDINGLSVFKEKMDESVDAKIAESGQSVTYTLSRNSNNEIVLTGSDKSETKVTDENTTYSFTQSGTTLTITPSDGEPIEITLGENITEDIISGWGFTKNTGTYSKPTSGIPKVDLANDVQSSLNKADTALQSFEEQDPTVPSHVKSISTDDILNWNSKSDFSGDYNDLSNKPTIPTVPTNISEFNNDSGYITKAVNDLTNYYKKSDTYTQNEVNALISAIPKFSIAVVDSLPTSEISSTTIYLLKTSETETGNLYTEYIYLDGQWETLGTQTLDISGYVTTDTLTSELNKKVDKVDGKGLSTNDLTATLKSNYDSAYTHSTSTHAPSNAQVNVIETVKVNGTALTPSSKAVNIAVPTKASDIGAAASSHTHNYAGSSSAGGIATSAITSRDALWFGTSSTARSTVDKVATCSNFELKTGTTIRIRFTDTGTSNPTSGNLTLNVNSTGAKTVIDGKSNKTVLTYTSCGWFYNNMVHEFVYDGTNWVWMTRDNNTTYSNQSLGNGYGTCTTAASTTAKVVTLSGYNLVTNGIVAVKFTNAVPASATLNINSKGAKSVYYRGSAIVEGVINAGDIATFIYNGSQYHLISIDSSDKGTTLIGTLSAGQTSLVFSNSAITTNSTIDYYVDRFGVSATNIVVTSGQITMTFKAQSSALNVKVIVR